MTIAALSVTVIAGIIELIALCDGNVKPKLMVMGIRSIVVVIAMIFVLALFAKGVSKLGFYKDIGNQNCSDSFTNQFFRDTEAELWKYAIRWQVTGFIVVLVGLVLEWCFTVGLMMKLEGRSWRYNSGRNRNNFNSHRNNFNNNVSENDLSR